MNGLSSREWDEEKREETAAVRLQGEEQTPKYGVDSPLWEHSTGFSFFLSYNREQRRKRYLHENESLKEKVRDVIQQPLSSLESRRYTFEHA